MTNGVALTDGPWGGARFIDDAMRERCRRLAAVLHAKLIRHEGAQNPTQQRMPLGALMFCFGALAFTPNSPEHALARWVTSQGGFVGSVAAETRGGLRGLYARRCVDTCAGRQPCRTYAAQA